MQVPRLSARFIAVFAFFLGVVAVQAQLPTLQPAPPSIKLAEQADSPVRLTLEGVRTKEDGAIWLIQVRALNSSGKGLSAIVTAGMNEGEVNGQMMFSTAVRSGHSFLIALTGPKPIDGDREISIDFLTFEDGSTWGPDINGSSQFLKGFKAGRLRLVEDISGLLASYDEVAVKAFLERQPYLPEYTRIPKKTKLEEGIVRGYGSELFGLRQTLSSDGLAGVEARISALKEELNPSKIVGEKRIVKASSINDVLKIEKVDVDGREIGLSQAFQAGDDWMRGVSVTLRNVSGKQIVSFSLDTAFPETTATGNRMMSSIVYGRRPGLPAEVKVAERPPVAAGESVVLSFLGDEYDKLIRFLNSRQPLAGLSKAELSIGMVFFNDGTAWSTGSFMKPHDTIPNRWTPIERSK